MVNVLISPIWLLNLLKNRLSLNWPHKNRFHQAVVMLVTRTTKKFQTKFLPLSFFSCVLKLWGNGHLILLWNWDSLSAIHTDCSSSFLWAPRCAQEHIAALLFEYYTLSSLRCPDVSGQRYFTTDGRSFKQQPPSLLLSSGDICFSLEKLFSLVS